MRRRAWWQWSFVILGAVVASLVAIHLPRSFLFWVFLPYLIVGSLVIDLPISLVAVAACLFLEDSIYLTETGKSFPSLLGGDVLVFGPAFVIVILRDLVKRENLRATSAQDKLDLVSEARDAILIREADTGRILFWNRGSEMLYGWGSDEVMGKTTSSILRTIFPSSEQNTMTTLQEQKTWFGRLTQITKDGKIVVTDSRWVIGKSGNILELNTDITDSIRAAEQEKRADLAEVQVKERDAFISVAAHELKTPITSIYAVTELLYRKLPNGEINGNLGVYVDILQRQTERLTRMIERILVASRLAHENLSPEIGPVNIGPLVERVIETQKIVSPENDIILEAPPSLVVLADGLRIEQVVSNLIANAAKYSPNATPINVKIERQGSGLVISVRDHGLGIEPKHIPHIFEQFYRAHDVSHRSGMGLGLYIAQNIAQQHGGRIDVECPEDGGSLFTLYLPNSVEAP